MKIDKIYQIKKEYYTDYLLNLILKRNYVYDYKGSINLYREFAILNNKTNNDIEYKKIAFRGITFSNISYMKKTLFNLNYPEKSFLNNDSSLYCSVARILKIPLFPFKDRGKHTSDFFKNNFEKYIKHFDLYMDFDLDDDNYTLFLTEILNLIKILETYEINFYLTFSGSRGFKLLIENNDFYSRQNIIKIHNNIKKKFKLKYLDTSGNFISNKLMKADYSLVFKNNICRVALPIFKENITNIFYEINKDQSFDIFNYDNLKDKFNYPIYDGYPFLRKYYSNYTINNKETTNNFKTFVNENDLLK